MDYTYDDVAQTIDHSLLTPTLTTMSKSRRPAVSATSTHYCFAMRDLGVTRIGASRTKDILEECRRRLGEEIAHST